MALFHLDDLQVTLDQLGATRYVKVTYPITYGRYSQIRTKRHQFRFDLNGEVRYVQGRHGHWPDEGEWLERTIGGDWVYYATDVEYRRIFSLLGEYYCPCFTYPTNTLFQQASIPTDHLEEVLAALTTLRERLRHLAPTVSSPQLRSFLNSVTARDARTHAPDTNPLYALLGGPVPVLPPDTRHVDYDVIPAVLADGCLYNCGFCSVKTGHRFRRRTEGEIESQIEGLRAFFGPELVNRNAVFLGQHDALFAGEEAIEFAARRIYEELQLERSVLSGRYLFLFGSVDSVLGAGESLFSMLDRLPYYTCINVGLESFDQDTLDALGKPVDVGTVDAAFARMEDVNRRYSNVEMTANLVLSRDLSLRHDEAIVERGRSVSDRFYSKGALYLSPLDNPVGKREMRERFLRIKRRTRLPTFLYMIQRL